ncbi:MAG: SCP2 sterol-binding domain-containing protein [Promethearchaeota archaeon]
MGVAKENLEKIVEEMEGNKKVNALFGTDIGGKDVDWDMTFQFNLNGEDPFYLEIKNRKAKLFDGKASNPEVVMTGDNNAIVKICHGKGDFTHAISREEISVEQGKVMDVIRLTKAITLVLKTK